jgi:hypothetical protein
MGINIGLDIGAISLKLAALGRPGDRPILATLCATHPQFRMTEMGARPLVLSEYRRIAGSPIQSTYDLLQEFYEIVPEAQVEGIRVTGSGSRTIAKVLGLFFENEFKAIARMMATVYPQVRTVFEIGGESSKYIRLDGGSIVDYDRSGECAAGPGRSSISRRYACSTRSRRSAESSARPRARRGSPGAARCSPRAT